MTASRILGHLRTQFSPNIVDKVRRKLPRAICKRVEDSNLFRQQKEALESELSTITTEIQILSDKENYIRQTKGLASTAISVAHKMSLVHADVSLELTGGISHWSANTHHAAMGS
jgi:hypothetical protein